MNRKIKAYQAIIYIVLFYLAAVLFLLGPGKLLEKDRLLAGAENPVGTVEVREDQQVQQVLIAEGDYLRYLELYVTSPKSPGEYYHLLVYDENNEMLINRDFELKADEVPGFVRIPLGIDTTRGTAYVWQLQGKSEPLELSYENTGETGLTCFGSYYVLADSTSTQMETQNIVMRLVYTDKPSAAVMMILKTILCVAAAAFILAAVYLSPKQPKLNNKITWRFVHWVTAGPLITVGTAVLLWEVYGRRAFGGKPDDLIVYGLGIGLFFVFSAWVLFSRRGSKYHPPFEEMLTEQGMDWLQAAAFAGVLLGGIHYMNALYQNQQNLAYREVLSWAAFLILTMVSPAVLFSKKGGRRALIGLIAGGIWYVVQSLTQKEAMQTNELLSKQIFLEALIVFFFVLILAELAARIRAKKLVEGSVNRIYTAVLFGFMALLVIFRNTRLWPIYLAVVFALYYVFYLGWNKKKHLLNNFCNGVMLNFALAVVFAFARRPFRAWVYSRYNFVFHTVTITATYLTLVLCVLTVRLFVKLSEGMPQNSTKNAKGMKHKPLRKKDAKNSCPADLWGTFLLYGIAVSLLFLTLSRTGYLAVLVMTAVLLIFVPVFVYRQKIREIFRALVYMIAAFVICLPMTYSGIRLLPALYNDPYLYEIEDSASAIHKDDPKDSDAYMSVSYFKYVIENKLLSDASELTEQTELFCNAVTGKPSVKNDVLVASAQDEAGMSDAEDFSNGRLEIFRSYMDNWNATGHTEMGVLLPDGSISVHAHNTYLQVIHDHGLIVGIYFLCFGAGSICLMFAYAIKKIREDAYAVLPLAVMLGFCVAGLVEWLFHPCNPLGFSAMALLAPLMSFSPRRHAA